MLDELWMQVIDYLNCESILNIQNSRLIHQQYMHRTRFIYKT